MEVGENSSNNNKRNLVALSEKLNQLVDREIENKQTLLEELSSLIAKTGVNETELNSLLDLVFELRTPVYLKSSQKRFIIKNLLIPNGNYKLSKHIAYRIISSIGVPQIYYKNRKESKLKKLSTGIQLCLLEWLICSYHLFESKVFNNSSMITILVNYLSYEFLRPYMANLIFLSVLNNNRMFKTYFMPNTSHNIAPFKPWHVQRVVDLFYKFPLDEYLKSLLILFKSLQPSIDFKKFAENDSYHLNNLGTLNPKIFVYPNFNYLDKLKDIQEINGGLVTEEQISQEQTINDNLRYYDNFNSSVKKRKKNGNSEKLPDVPDLDVIEFGNGSRRSNNVSINDIHSLESLVGNFENIRSINISALFNPQKFGNIRYSSDKFKKLYFILHGLSIDNEKWEKSIRKLDYYIRLSILDNNLTIRDLDILCDKIADFFSFTLGLLFLPLIKDYLCFKFDSPISGDNEYIHKFENLAQRLKFLKYLPVLEFEDFNENIIQNILAVLDEESHINAKKSRREQVLVAFVNELASLFSTWYSIYAHNSDPELKVAAFKNINGSLPIIYKFIVQNFTESSIVLQILLLRIFKFIQSLDSQDLNDHINALTLVLPQNLFYQLIFSNNPLVMSEICGYMAFCKSFKFKESDIAYKNLQNSYIMDTLNFIWRDKSFYYDDNSTAFSRAMFLDPEFLKHLRKLNIFNFSGLLSLHTVGNLFHNPCWSFITTQLIRELEDKTERITIRHAGPITEESVSKLIHASDVEWLSLSYDELKLQVLRSLDDLGYTGLGDLLFSSLKTLMNKRN
ncbi:unnamed protein product [Debaryomyces fabryi]|nr:unnamed protein product [Debaryomyces fabryi]